MGNYVVTANKACRRLWKEKVSAYFKELPEHFCGDTVETHEIPKSG
jgi:hypothetical protein